MCAAAGQLLDPWQLLVLDDILGIRDDGQWAAFETCTVVQRQNGKGAIIEAIELAGLFLLGEQLILHSAHEYKTAQEAFLRIKALIDGCADLSRHVKAIREANGEQQVILMDGARLRFVARSKGSGRGFSGQRNILDEAYALTRTQLAALLPTMSAQPNPQMNLFSTVPDVDTMPEPGEAVLPDVRKRALAAAESGEPGRLTYHDWSMEPGEDPADVNNWYQWNPAMGYRISEDYVRSELASLGPAKFSTERGGLWPPDSADRWGVISEQQWLDSEDPHSSPVDPIVFAIAMNYERTHTCIGLAGVRADGDLHVEVPPLDHRTGSGWVVQRAKEINERWKPARWVVAGPAASLIPDLEAVGLVVKKMTSAESATGFGMIFDGLTRKPGELAADQVEGEDPRPVRRVWHRPSPTLATSLAGAKARHSGDAGRTWESRDVDVDMSPVRAITDALWGFLTREPEINREPLVAWG